MPREATINSNGARPDKARDKSLDHLPRPDWGPQSVYKCPEYDDAGQPDEVILESVSVGSGGDNWSLACYIPLLSTTLRPSYTGSVSPD